mgnify:CR=1 FL=1
MVRAESLRSKAYNLWVQNPYITAKKACKELQLIYKTHGRYVNNLLSAFRSYHKFGLPQEAHPFPEHRVFEWQKVQRDDVSCGVALRSGWVEVANRNGMLVFRHPLGSVHWYREGLVRLYLKGELQLAKAKELFCRAFSWFSPEEWKKCLDVPLKEVYKKWIFEVGAPVPRFDIRQFERSHGIRIFTDGSHPTAVHVGESVPFWIDEQRQATHFLAETVQQFGTEIKEHLKLIQLWQKEAKVKRKPIILRKIKGYRQPQQSLLNWMI